MEHWKPINICPDRYLISNHGRIKSIKTGVIRALSPCAGGYLKCNLHLGYSKGVKDQKTVKPHRLVAQNFIPNPKDKPCVNHKDGNNQNNHHTNLEWCTHKENSQHSLNVLGNIPPDNLAKAKPVLGTSKTGVMYFWPSAQKAAKDLKVVPSAIKQAIYREGNCKGLRMEHC